MGTTRAGPAPAFRYNSAMNKVPEKQEIDYLVIGHMTQDITPRGSRIGGTAAYAALLAHRFNLQVGMITSFPEDFNHSLPRDIQLINVPTGQSTVFENKYTSQGRKQVVHSIASKITADHIPTPWRSAKIVHLAPVFNEFSPHLGREFPRAHLGFTLQGWLRTRNAIGRVNPTWYGAFPDFNSRSAAAVVSSEDLDDQRDWIPTLKSSFPVLILTRGDQEAVLYHRGHPSQKIPVVPIPELDPTGAGDIFAAAFFISYFQGIPLQDAARQAAVLAGQSVTRAGLSGVPQISAY